MDESVNTYIDSKAETVRAQNDARFAEVLSKLETSRAEVRSDFAAISGELKGLSGELQGLAGRIGDRPTLGQLAALTITTGIGIVAVIAAILAYGGGRFSEGLSIGPIQAEIQETRTSIHELRAARRNS